MNMHHARTKYAPRYFITRIQNLVSLKISWQDFGRHAVLPSFVFWLSEFPYHLTPATFCLFGGDMFRNNEAKKTQRTPNEDAVVVVVVHASAVQKYRHPLIEHHPPPSSRFGSFATRGCCYCGRPNCHR